jgi:PAS domain S-box-containing protein
MTTQNYDKSRSILGSDESFRLLVDSVADYAIIMLDTKGQVASWNAGAEKNLGYRQNEIIGRHFSCFYSSESVNEGLPEKTLNLATENGRYEYEGWRKRQDGSRFWANTLLSPMLDSQGTLIGFAEITRDFSERKNADYARSLIEASLDPLVTIAPDGKITDVNAATESITGRSRIELIGTDFCDYFTDPEKARNGYQQVFRESMVRDYPLELRHANGRVTSVLYNASVYKDEDGAVVGVFAAARDITERKLSEERIKQQSREILELSTPVMQVWQGVVAVPLIGCLDSQRTQQFMERLLDRIVETNSPVALVDIMGVPTIDTQTAQHLIETITAVRLLGAQVVLTGVRPAIAQTLVHLGIDLSGITTRSSMAAGLLVALDLLKLQVVKKSENHRGD